MKRFILSILILITATFSAFSHVEHYKNFSYLEYDLFRNNKLIGNHKYFFERKNETLTVKSIVNFKITKLGVDLYKYFAESDEIYKNNSFYSYTSKTKQNKKDKYVNISVDNKNKQLIIDGSSYKGSTEISNIVGTWWDHDIVKSKAQISAISGRVIEQEVVFLGKEKIQVGNKFYNTLHFKFKSSDENLPDNKKLNTDIWYEENTFLWVKAQFVKQGNWEYRIKSVK